ncbi:MAG: hypothetical protein M3M94_02610 [Actinomycetota bacterium]|nr:hypothetical protein [Actinomycetota bacterium]
MKSALFTTPRPVPGRLLPALAGGLVLALALPVFVVADWPLGGWALGALLWTGLQAVDLVLTRVGGRTGNLAGSAVQGFRMFFKTIAVLVVLVAAVASDAQLALAAALTYALAYTLDLGVSLLAYFGAEA